MGVMLWVLEEKSRFSAPELWVYGQALHSQRSYEVIAWYGSITIPSTTALVKLYAFPMNYSIQDLLQHLIFMSAMSIDPTSRQDIGDETATRLWGSGLARHKHHIRVHRCLHSGIGI